MFEARMFDARWKTQKMQARSTAWSLTRSVTLAAILGGTMVLAVAPGSVRAQDDDKDSIWNLDKRIMEGVAKGLGLQRGDSVGLDYRERSPLVVPPTRNLPPPE